MQTHATPYMHYLTNQVYLIIEAELAPQIAAAVAQKAFEYHFTDNASMKFQKYYVETIRDFDGFLSGNAFFRKFKTMYALQGIDKAYLDRLEAAKPEILEAIQLNDLTTLYLRHFAQASIQHGDEKKTKNLASFFTKLVHTFRPADYCALDNPIKNHFGLAKEGFFVSFLVISAAYGQWVKQNTTIVAEMRKQIESHPVGNLYSSKMSDLKLLDLVFWVKANKPEWLVP